MFFLTPQLECLLLFHSIKNHPPPHLLSKLSSTQVAPGATLRVWPVVFWKEGPSCRGGKGPKILVPSQGLRSGSIDALAPSVRKYRAGLTLCWVLNTHRVASCPVLRGKKRLPRIWWKSCPAVSHEHKEVCNPWSFYSRRCTKCREYALQWFCVIAPRRFCVLSGENYFRERLLLENTW